MSGDVADVNLQVVEILFGRGLVKVLFATETFAMVRVYLEPTLYRADVIYRG